MFFTPKLFTICVNILMFSMINHTQDSQKSIINKGSEGLQFETVVEHFITVIKADQEPLTSDLENRRISIL